MEILGKGKFREGFTPLYKIIRYLPYRCHVVCMLSRIDVMPMSCMQCENADCVSVCPTGASYKREEDGIVLVDQDKCMGCNLCAWACPYGARELDQEHYQKMRETTAQCFAMTVQHIMDVKQDEPGVKGHELDEDEDDY